MMMDASDARVDSKKNESKLTLALVVVQQSFVHVPTITNIERKTSDVAWMLRDKIECCSEEHYRNHKGINISLLEISTHPRFFLLPCALQR
jgi:hypothetical protein